MRDKPAMNQLLSTLKTELVQWRRDLHAHPETAFEEQRTAAFVAKKLTEFGLEVTQGIAETGVVASLRCGNSKRAFGLRADMDALHLQETNTFDHRSINQGKMHACGHDGHTVMLLGAAKLLTESPQFDGTIHFIFQPAEENEGGARVMLEENLLEQFPMEAIFGMHNLPGLQVGEFAINEGYFMASCNRFELEIIGKGCHAGLPEQGIDAILIGAQIIQAFQTVLSRMKPAQNPAVISITQFHAGDALNICPETAIIKGSCRSFDPELDLWKEQQLEKIANNICAGFGARCNFTYHRQYPALKNHPKETATAISVAQELVGTAAVNAKFQPVMGSEDFAFYLEKIPGSYILIGNGLGQGDGATGCMLHNSGYDFNDEILTLGVNYWVNLARSILG